MCRISKTTRYQTRGLSLAGWGKRWFCILLFSFMHAFLPQFTHDIRHFNSESGASHVLSMSTASQSDTEAGGASLPLALVTDVWGQAHASVTQRQRDTPAINKTYGHHKKGVSCIPRIAHSSIENICWLLVIFLQRLLPARCYVPCSSY